MLYARLCGTVLCLLPTIIAVAYFQRPLVACRCLLPATCVACPGPLAAFLGNAFCNRKWTQRLTLQSQLQSQIGNAISKLRVCAICATVRSKFNVWNRERETQSRREQRRQRRRQHKRKWAKPSKRETERERTTRREHTQNKQIIIEITGPLPTVARQF